MTVKTSISVVVRYDMNVVGGLGRKDGGGKKKKKL